MRWSGRDRPRRRRGRRPRAAQRQLAAGYRHFPSKTDLVLAYLQAAHDAIVAQLADVTVGGLIADVCEKIQRPEFRGCAFICAAAEFEDEQHPVRRAVAAHRGWYLGVVRDALGSDEAARHFVMLRDGAFVGADLGDAGLAAETFRQLTMRLRPSQ